MKFKTAFKIIGLLFGLCLITKQGMCSSSDSSVVIHFGEALAPANLRLNINTFDIGFDGKGGGVYVGNRLWKGNTYGGAGVWVGFSNSIGIYGVLGKDWTFFKVLLTSAEFYSVGTVTGTTFAVVNLGVGIKW